MTKPAVIPAATIPQNSIRQAIVTKYIAPTNKRGARIKATAAAGSVTIGYDEAGTTPDERHYAAAQKLAAKFGWTDPKNYGPLIAGGLPDGSYVFVEVPREVAEAYAASVAPKYRITARTWYGKSGGEFRGELCEVGTGRKLVTVSGTTWGSDAWSYAMRDAMHAQRPDLFPDHEKGHPTIYFREVCRIEYQHDEVARKRDL
jgi:hypothetical protein